MDSPVFHEPPKAAAASNAIALLMVDHRQVERWIQELQNTTSMRREEDLAVQICCAIRIHTDLDEHIFYPAYLQATRDQHSHHVALIEHAALNGLIDEIERLGPTEEMFFARVHMLCEMFQEHVRTEEKNRGIFSVAQQSRMDLESLGAALNRRKAELSEWSHLSLL